MKYILNLGRNSESILAEAEYIYGKAESILLIKRDGESLEVPLCLKQLAINPYKTNNPFNTEEYFKKFLTPVVYIANGGTTQQLFKMTQFIGEEKPLAIKAIDLQRDGESILYEGKYFHTKEIINLKTDKFSQNYTYSQTGKSPSNDGMRNEYESFNYEEEKDDWIRVHNNHNSVIPSYLENNTIKIDNFIINIKEIKCIGGAYIAHKSHFQDIMIIEKNEKIYRIQKHNGTVLEV